MSKTKVAEQKGAIKPQMESYRTETYFKKVSDAVKDANLRRSGQHFEKTFEPKK